MRWKRILLFLLMIAIGAALGLLYGWVIQPNRSGEVSLATLRADYQTDYVLMVAEIYNTDHDLEQAVRRLAYLEGPAPAQLIGERILQAHELGYTAEDLKAMQSLSDALQNPVSGTGPTQQP